MKHYDITVIGAGPGGYVAALKAAKNNLNVALVDRDHLGGVCLNWGCIPTKTLMKTASAYRLCQSMETLGLTLPQLPTPNLKKIIQRTQDVAGTLRQGLKSLMKRHAIDVLTHDIHFKPGAFDGTQWTLYDRTAQDPVLTSQHVIVATGARTRTLPHLNHLQGIWTSKEALAPTSLPQSLLIIGSGAIGMEFASFYQTLGTKVTVVEQQKYILPAEDHEVSTYAQKIFTQQGMTLWTESTVSQATQKDTSYLCTLQTPQGEQSITAEKILVAIGVEGPADTLGLHHTAVERHTGFIHTTPGGVTAQKNLYAIGDVTGGPWLAHKATHEALACIDHITTGQSTPLKAIPGCTYTLPEIASVGAREHDLKRDNIPYRKGKCPFHGNGKALAAGVEGFVKCLFHQDTGALLGAHMVGDGVTEMISVPTLAQNMEAVEADIFHTIFPHPTLSEAFHEAALDAYNQGIHL